MVAKQTLDNGSDSIFVRAGDGSVAEQVLHETRRAESEQRPSALETRPALQFPDQLSFSFRAVCGAGFDEIVLIYGHAQSKSPGDVRDQDVYARWCGSPCRVSGSRVT